METQKTEKYCQRKIDKPGAEFQGGEKKTLVRKKPFQKGREGGFQGGREAGGTLIKESGRRRSFCGENRGGKERAGKKKKKK